MRHSLIGCRFVGVSLLAAVVAWGCGGAEGNEAAPGGDADDIASASASASASGCSVLSHKDQPLFWNGVVGPEDAPRGHEPAECASVSCDHLRLRLDLPPGTFHKPNKPGGVVIGLRWPDATNTLDLFVYRGDTLVASSAGIIATAQAVFLPEPDNGTYALWIAADPSYNVDASVPYEAFAEVEYRPKIPPVRDVLPDLEFRAPRHVRFATPSFPLFEPDPPPGATCFNSEADEDGAHLCLRFDQVIANVGVAPLEVREAIPKDPSNTALNASQRVYRSDGSFADVPAGDFEYHPIHQHYHYKSFAVSRLWRSNAAGARLGAAPIRSTRKLSFCIADIEIDRWGQPGVDRRAYFAPDCLMPQAEDANFDYLIVGLGQGWADVYDWFLPGQYVEVSGVTDGYYLLQSCADPDGKLRESDESNNCIDTLLRLSSMSTPAPQVETLGSF